MDTRHWERIEALFFAALARDAGAEPLNLMRKAMEQNMEFWNRMTRSTLERDSDK